MCPLCNVKGYVRTGDSYRGPMYQAGECIYSLAGIIWLSFIVTERGRGPTPPELILNTYKRSLRPCSYRALSLLGPSLREIRCIGIALVRARTYIYIWSKFNSFYSTNNNKHFIVNILLFILCIKKSK